MDPMELDNLEKGSESLIGIKQIFIPKSLCECQIGISFVFIEFEVPGVSSESLQHRFKQASSASRPLPRLVHVEVQHAQRVHLVLKNATLVKKVMEKNTDQSE